MRANDSRGVTGGYTRTTDGKRNVDIGFVRTLFARVKAILADVIALNGCQLAPFKSCRGRVAYIVRSVEDVSVVQQTLFLKTFHKALHHLID